MSHQQSPSADHPDGPRYTITASLPLAAATAGAACLGLIATSGPLWSSGILFPHRLRALLAVLSAVLLWALCARIAPSLGRPQSKLRRFIGIAAFLAGGICLLAALQTAKIALAYLPGGFIVLITLSVFLTSHTFATTHGRRGLRAVSVLGWSTLLGAVSISSLVGEWDTGSAVIASGYGALCTAVSLSSWPPPQSRRLVRIYSSVVLFGCISLPAISIVSGQPTGYLITYLILWPAVVHLRRTSSTATLPPPRQPLFLSLGYLALLGAVSRMPSQSTQPPISQRPSAAQATTPPTPSVR